MATNELMPSNISTGDNTGIPLSIGARHYRAYVGPPDKYDLLAAVQFNLLTCLGLREYHFLLDIGCGSVRAGRLFIPYLIPSHYFGIEPERWLVEEGIRNELGEDIVRIKKPVFSYNSHFDCGVFDQKFDFVIVQSVFSHATQKQIRQCLSSVSTCMSPSGICVATFVMGSSDYEGYEWVYPDCVEYTGEHIKRVAIDLGLEANLIDWLHPNGQTWVVLTRPGNSSLPNNLLKRDKTRNIRLNTSAESLTTSNSPTCIIGMHRSGTSMVARLLNVCGLNLGPEDKLMGASPSNSFGHFEHTGFVEINDDVLNHFGGSWENPPLLNSGWEKDPALQGLFDKAESLIGTMAGMNPWGWKEPRTSLLLPFWQKLIPDLRYIICIRNPLEVARSLKQRDGISIPAAAQLWCHYTRAAIENTEGKPRIFTFYEEYFSDQLAEANRLSAFCGLGAVKEPLKINEVISGVLRHQTSGTVELLNEESISLECKMLYLWLRALASEERSGMESNKGTKTGALNGIGKVLSLLDELHDQEKTLQLQTVLAAKEMQLASAVLDKEQQLSALRQRMDQEFRAEIAQLRDQNARLQAFASAVRKTPVYRFYKTFLSPFTSR